MQYKRQGFLLIEVMVSIVIITGAIVLISRSYWLSKKALDRSTGILKASALLEEKLWEYELEEAIEIGNKSGNFDKDRNYRWSSSTVPTTDRNLDLNCLTLEVYREDKPQDIRYSIASYFKNIVK